MADPVLQAELMRSLARLVRGLSALFWGLPLALLTGVQTAVNNWFGQWGLVAPGVTAGLLYYGLWQLSYFQQQERVWRVALERAKLVGLANIGLTPFLYWWQELPGETFYTQAVGLLALSALVFLFCLNQVVQRLAAMLPDEMVRLETRLFTTVNRYVLASIPVLLAVYIGLMEWNPAWVYRMLGPLAPLVQWVLLFLVLLPLAMTMALIWKIKELILNSVFGPQL